MFRILHTDNAQDFKAEGLKFASRQRGFDLVKRPLKSPNFGAAIESGFRTFMQKTHTLPGTTNSNVKKNNKYKSEEHAALTLEDYEHWFTDYNVNDYHQRLHSAIKVPPISLWRDSILGSDTKPGIGLPPIIEDEHRLYLDFLPMLKKPITQYGVTFNGLTYWKDIFNGMINLKDPKNPTKNKHYIFRFEYDDLSKIWFYDEVSNTYLDIPTFNKTAPTLTFWDMKQSRKEILEKGIKKIDAQLIYNSHLHRQAFVEEKVVSNTKLRRADQRSRNHKKAQKIKSISL